MIKFLLCLIPWVLACAVCSQNVEYDTSTGSDQSPQNDFVKPASLRSERLVIRNQIAYHFRRTVNEVIQAMFLSASINMTSLLLSVELLQGNKNRMERLCGKLPNFHARRSLSSIEVSARTNIETYDSSNPCFILINEVREVSHAEAKAICQSRGMRLPELYTDTERYALATYLTANHISACFAGIEMDLVAGFARFITTGLPIWKGIHTAANHTRQPLVSRFMDVQMERLNAEYVYDDSGELHYHEMGPEAVSYHGLTKVGDFYSKADREKVLFEFKARVVCSPPYPIGKQTHDWMYYDEVRSNHLLALVYKSYLPGLSKSLTNVGDTVTTTPPPVAPYNGLAAQMGQGKIVSTETDLKADFIKDWDNALVGSCRSAVSILDQTLSETMVVLDQRLKDVGIEVRSAKRDKRSASTVTQFFLQSGLDLFRSLSELVNLLPLTNVTGTGHSIFSNLTEANKVLRGSLTNNPHYFELLTQVVKENSIPTMRYDPVDSTVEVLHRDLSRIIDAVEASLPAYRPAFLAQLQHATLKAKEIRDLTERGLHWLSNVIQATLNKHTSTNVFPQSSMDLVNQWLKKRSIPATVDKSIYRRATHLMVDPDKRVVTAVVDALALSVEPLELVQLIAIPFFESGTAHQPALDYEFLVLNQMAGTFRPLSLFEAIACLTDQCYITGVEMPTSTRHCGIAQLFGRHLYDCQFASNSSNGLYLRAVPPEGIIYSVATTAIAQLFCGKNILVGQPTLLKGVGTVYVPPGCTIVVDDHIHPAVKVKGTPSHFNVEAPSALVTLQQNVPANMLNRRPKQEVNAVSILPLPELLAALRLSIEINKSDIIVLTAKLWGCVTFITAIVGALILCVQVSRQKSKRTVDKETFLSFQKDVNSKVDDLARLRNKVSFLQSMVQLEQMDLGAKNPKTQIRGTVPEKKVLGNPYSRLASLSTNCVSYSPYHTRWDQKGENNDKDLVAGEVTSPKRSSDVTGPISPKRDCEVIFEAPMSESGTTSSCNELYSQTKVTLSPRSTDCKQHKDGEV